MNKLHNANAAARWIGDRRDLVEMEIEERRYFEIAYKFRINFFVVNFDNIKVLALVAVAAQVGFWSILRTDSVLFYVGVYVAALGMAAVFWTFTRLGTDSAMVEEANIIFENTSNLLELLRPELSNFLDHRLPGEADPSIEVLSYIIFRKELHDQFDNDYARTLYRRAVIFAEKAKLTDDDNMKASIVSMVIEDLKKAVGVDRLLLHDMQLDPHFDAINMEEAFRNIISG